MDRTPREWLDFLEQRQRWRRPGLLRYENYYDGKHNLAFATSKFREAFGDLFSAFADNFCQLVVDVPVDRLHIDGFDFGNERSNTALWKLWRASNMEARAQVAHTEAVKTGTAYILVDPSGRVTIEHALQCYVEVDPADPMHRYAGLKKWVDEVAGKAYANVYLPDAVHKFEADLPTTNPSPVYVPGQSSASSPNLLPIIQDWEPRSDVAPVVRNPFGVVPLIPLENNPTLLIGGRSDLEVVIPLQDAINKLVTDMIVASEFQAFKQRVLLGVEVPKDENGDPLPNVELMAAISRTWFIEDENASVAELSATDLTNYVGVIEMCIQHVATKVRIPPQNFLATHGTMSNVSADSMGVIESGFVSKVERKQGDFGPSWREAMRLVAQAKSIPLNGDDSMGLPVWRPASPPQIAALADSLVKYRSLGVPLEWIWEQAGATPEQQTEWRRLYDAEQQKLADQALATAKATAEAHAAAANRPTPPGAHADPSAPPAAKPNGAKPPPPVKPPDPSAQAV